jgi:adenylylsulfate kinase-like enzyme
MTGGAPVVAQVPVLLITGPVGVGKTSVAFEVSERLDRAGVHHALVDVDSLRWCYPPPPEDPFRSRLALRNLAAVWPNFRAMGATRLVLVDVVETRAQLDGYRAAVSGAAVLVVRLRASPETLAARVRRRETGSALERHLRRAAELAASMEQARVEDLLVETDGRSIEEVAREVLTLSRWLRPAPETAAPGARDPHEQTIPAVEPGAGASPAAPPY